MTRISQIVDEEIYACTTRHRLNEWALILMLAFVVTAVVAGLAP